MSRKESQGPWVRKCRRWFRRYLYDFAGRTASEDQLGDLFLRLWLCLDQSLFVQVFIPNETKATTDAALIANVTVSSERKQKSFVLGVLLFLIVVLFINYNLQITRCCWKRNW